MAKVMLVEDDNNLREIYGARLQAEGHDIVAAKDGEEALALAVKEKPDLIISDVMMPRISGFDMLDILRNAPETKNTKVIMMTALSQAEDKARADKLGADRYLVKSQVTLEDVANVVREVLDGTPPATEPVPAVEAAVPAPPTVAPAATEPAPSVEAIANPVIEVLDEPDSSQVQPPPTDAPQPDTATEVAITDQPAAGGIADSAAPGIAAAPDPVAVPEPPADPVPAASVSDPADPATIPADQPAAEPPSPTSAPAATDDTSTTNTSSAVPPVQAPADSTTAPATDPAPATPVETPAIKVELPNMEPPAEQAVADAPSEESMETPIPTTPEETNNDSFVGPNLAEALASEEESPKAKTQEPEGTSSIDDLPVPVVSNGVPTNVVVEPTLPQLPEPEEPDPESTTDTGVSTAASTNTAAGMRVIKPITDPTAQPDINELLAAEERKAAVENPIANTVITPGKTAGEPTTPGAAAPAPPKPDDNNPVNNIAL